MKIDTNYRVVTFSFCSKCKERIYITQDKKAEYDDGQGILFCTPCYKEVLDIANKQKNP